MSKYTPLRIYLQSQPVGQTQLTLTFEKIEQILSAKLPPSAYQHQAWWANERNGAHVHAHSWLEAGWKVESFDLNRKMVRFVREK